MIVTLSKKNYYTNFQLLRRQSMSQLYYNDVITDIASCKNKNEVINYFRRIDDKRLTDDEWQDILETIAEKCDTSIETVLSCLDLPDGTDFDAYIANEIPTFYEENKYDTRD